MLVATVPEELTAKRRARPSVPSTWYLWPRPRRFVGCFVREKEGERKKEKEREKDRKRESRQREIRRNTMRGRSRKEQAGVKRNNKASPAGLSVGRNRETGERWRKKNWFQKAARVYTMI